MLKRQWLLLLKAKVKLWLQSAGGDTTLSYTIKNENNNFK